MKKKLLSIIMSLVMFFTIIPNSIVFANEESKDHPNAVDLINQDGLEGSISLKSGIGFGTYNSTDNPYSDEIECAEYFEGMNEEEGDKARLLKDEYDGWQIMKIQIKISKKSGLEVKEIIPDNYKEVVPTRIKESYKEYFELQEDDTEYVYNYYMKGNGIYSFTIRYTLDGVEKESKVSYKTKENLLNIPDVNMMTELYVGFGDSNAYQTDDDYVTEEFLNATQETFPGGKEGTLFGFRNGTIKNILPKIKSLEGVQYLDNLLYLDLAQGMTSSNLSDLYKDNFGFGGIEPITEGYYEKLDEFRVSEGKKPDIPLESYSPGMIAECVSKMPNLADFYCHGSGFKDFTAFKNSNGKLDFLRSRFNEIKSLKGIENCKDLRIVYLGKNNISSIKELSELNENAIELLDIQLNKIKDLRPLDKTLSKKAVPGSSFTAAKQTIIEKDVVVSENAEDYIKIELPMPIDIDGSLTETQKVLAKYNDITKEYPIIEENGKKYIKLNKIDFDGNIESELENISFKFEFNNANGKDSRTKNWFNGTVTFNATFNPQVSNKYGVEYEFISGTPGKDLQGRLNDLLPEDLKLYKEGDTIKAIQPEKTVVKVRDGEWTFDGYDRDEKIANKSNADENINVKFIGTWNFHKREEEKEKGTVVYKFENRSDKYTDSDVDKNVIEVEKLKIPERFVLPVDNTEYDIDREINPKNPTDKNNNKIEVGKEIVVKDEELNTYIGWTFKGYEPEKLSIKPGVNEIIGIWKAKDIEIVDYEFKSDSDKKLPQEVLDELVEPEKHYDGEEHIKPTNPEDTGIEVSDGVWRFIGWDKKEITEIHHDEHFIGLWHFEPKSTGGGAGGGTITPTPNPNPTPDKEDPDRVEGDDRIETSIEASEILYPNGTNAVVLANAERFSDVLTANPFAVQEKASALLTYKDKLPEKTLKEIERLGAKKIYVSGGYEAVSKKVVDSLAAKGYEIYRFDGLDRYDTARKIAIKIREKGNKEVVELASGENYPDALCMTSMAVKDNAPILLTRKDSIPKYTKQALAEWDIESVKIGGLDEAISKDVQNQIDKGFEITKGNKSDSNVYDGAKKVSRFGGKDRYETSTIIAANSYPESKLGVYATGEDFPDALIAGNYAGRKEAPVLLVKRDTLPEVVEKYTKESKIKKATIIGGVNAVSDKVFNLIKAIINR